MVVVVGGFDFRGGVVVEGLVEARGVPPVNSLHCGDLDGLGGFPHALGVDEFGLVQAVDGLGHRVVVGVADGTDRGPHPGGDQRVGVRQRDIQGIPCRSGGSSPRLRAAGAGGHQRMFQGQQRQRLGVQG